MWSTLGDESSRGNQPENGCTALVEGRRWDVFNIVKEGVLGKQDVSAA